jgi:hypothetical protein
MTCAYRFEVLTFDPAFTFMRMAAFGPMPKGFKNRTIDLGKHLFTHHMLMVVRPASNNRVQLGKQHAGGYCLLGFEEGADMGQKPLNALLRGFYQQLALVLAQMLSKKIKPILDSGDAGLFFR